MRSFFWILVTLLVGGAVAGAAPLPTDGPGWHGDPVVWQFRGDGIHCRQKTSDSLAVYGGAPLAATVSVEAVFTPREADGRDWNVAGVAIVDDPGNFWHLALVQSPPQLGRQPSLELAEMRDGQWLAQRNLKIEIDEATDMKWTFGAPYRLMLSMDGRGITGTVAAADRKPIFRKRCAFTAPAVKMGRPALRIHGITGDFTDLRATWSRVVAKRPIEETFPPYAMEGVVSQISDKPTGFFRVVQKPDGRWWTIDPLGRGIVLLGVDHVTFQGHWCEKLGYCPHGKKNEKKYADHAQWEEETLGRLKEWGFNMLGAGCDAKLNHRGLAHTIFLNIGTHLGALGDEYDITPDEHRPCSAFPNVFHPDFKAFCRYRARLMCEPNRADSWLFGYFIDNELAWWGRGPLATGLFDAVMQKGASHTAKTALRDFLAERAENDVATFNNFWGMQIRGFDDLLQMPSLPSADQRQREVKNAFLRLAAERYFSITSRAVREADPNHLVLGARFAGTGGADPAVWEVAGKYCDVVTFNCYPMADLDEGRVYTHFGASAELVTDHFAKYYAYVKRPMLITEWSFPALDAGLPSVHGAGQRFRTQAQRTAATSLFARTMLSMPFLLGYDYFMWVDEPALGISTPFPEDSNYGLINEDGVPYELLTSMFATLHREAGAIRFKPAPEAQPRRQNVAVDAMTVARKAATGDAKAFFVREGDTFRAGNGRIELSGRLGDGHMVQRVTLDGSEKTIGAYNAMIHTLDTSGRDRWSDTRTVKAVEGRVVDGVAVVEITGATVLGSEAFEVTHRLILPPGMPWFLSELVNVRNTGTVPLTMKGLFFRLYSDFRGTPRAVPPNLWGMPEADCWIDEADGRFFGAVASKRSGIRIHFRFDATLNSVHPDARLELDEKIVAPGEEYVSTRPAYLICAAGRGGSDAWLKTAQELRAALEQGEHGGAAR